jgi:glyoxylase-like metal-dependent hydrolase (beta-lactamase superfamily II)
MMSNKSLIGVLLTLLSVSTGHSVIAQDFSGVEISAVQVSDNFHVLYGAGGNIGVFVDDDGIILIDDQFAPLSERINEAIDYISDQPIKYVINTHWHGDHSGGNQNFARGGAVIVGHENVRRRMSMEVFLPLYNSRTMPAPLDALPTVTFMHDISFYSGNERIRAVHVPNAHTDTDAFVHFGNANIIHLGDLLWTGSYPRIDVEHGGGSVDGVISALEKAMTLGNADTQYINGHGVLVEKGDAFLQSYLAMLRTVRSRVSNMIAEGMSLRQIMASQPTEDFDADFLGDNPYIDGDMFTRIMYISLTK